MSKLGTTVILIHPDTSPLEILGIMRLHLETVEQSYWMSVPNVLPANEIREKALGSFLECVNLLAEKSSKRGTE